MTTGTLTATASTLIRRPISEVFDAFVDPEVMCKFWFPRSDGPLEEDRSVHWFVGVDEDAFQIDVHVRTLTRPKTLVFEWGVGDSLTMVTWTFEARDQNTTVLRVEETGFQGTEDEVIARALDSTGGFNQVVIAAKALLEHGAEFNIVTDHA